MYLLPWGPVAERTQIDSIFSLIKIHTWKSYRIFSTVFFSPIFWIHFILKIFFEYKHFLSLNCIFLLTHICFYSKTFFFLSLRLYIWLFLWQLFILNYVLSILFIICQRGGTKIWIRKWFFFGGGGGRFFLDKIVNFWICSR